MPGRQQHADEIRRRNDLRDRDIEAHGRHLLVKLNGQTTVDVEDEKLATGPIGLQYAAGQVKFRSVRIRAQ